MHAAYLGALARAIRWVRGALTHGLPGARGPSAAGSQPARAWSRLGRGRAAATRARIRTAALSAHQTRRSCCRYALRRGGTANFARAVR